MTIVESPHLTPIELTSVATSSLQTEGNWIAFKLEAEGIVIVLGRILLKLSSHVFGGNSSGPHSFIAAISMNITTLLFLLEACSSDRVFILI